MGSEIVGYIFAGGKSSRMGLPKQQAVIGGHTLIEHAAGTLSAFCREVAVSGNIEDRARRVVPDRATDDGLGGPLLGMLSVFADRREGWIAVLACDLPFVTAGVFSQLAVYAEDDTDAIVPIQHDGFIQPLAALYRAETCLPAAERLIAAGRRDPQGLIQSVRTHFVPFRDLPVRADQLDPFFNVNTPEDLAAARSVFEK